MKKRSENKTDENNLERRKKKRNYMFSTIINKRKHSIYTSTKYRWDAFYVSRKISRK